MTHIHSVAGWTISFPIVRQRRRFLGYGEGQPGRLFFTTRKQAREYLTAYPRAAKWRGRILPATLTLKAREDY